MQCKVQSLDGVFNNHFHVLNTLQSPEVPEVLLYSQVVEQGVELRTVSQKLSSPTEVLDYVEALDRNDSSGGLFRRNNGFEGS